VTGRLVGACVETFVGRGVGTFVGTLVARVGAFVPGALVMEITKGPEVKPGVRLCASDDRKVEVRLTLELKEAGNTLGLAERSKFGDKVGPELTGGTSCADVQTDKNVSNKENFFIAVEFRIASRNG
jgi:hypothetical protein